MSRACSGSLPNTRMYLWPFTTRGRGVPRHSLSRCWTAPHGEGCQESTQSTVELVSPAPGNTPFAAPFCHFRILNLIFNQNQATSFNFETLPLQGFKNLYQESRVLNWGQFCSPRGCLAVSGDICSHHSSGSATGIQWVGAGVPFNIAQCTGSQPPMIELSNPSCQWY